MKTITATHLARNLRRVLDRLAVEGEGIVIERNRQQVARLLPGPARKLPRDPGIRQQRLAALRRLERKPLLYIDGTTGGIFGTLAAQIKAAGRQHRYRVQDLWLASQAVQHACRLLTRNKRDFEDIPGLSLVFYQLARHKPRA